MRKFTIVVLSLLISANVVSQTDVKDTYNVLVDNTGNISLPKEYRQNWMFLGSYFVQSAPTPTGETSHDMHTVYTQPYAAAHYRKHGNFPDGAVLIKVVHATKTEPLTTGLASYQDAPKVIFAMVKTAKTVSLATRHGTKAGAGHCSTQATRKAKPPLGKAKV